MLISIHLHLEISIFFTFLVTPSKLSKANSQQEHKDVSDTASNNSASTTTQGSSWRSWSAFEMISSASKSVANVTTKVTQSLSTAIESINIPDPEQMAQMQAEEKKSKIGEESPVHEESAEKSLQEEESSVFKLDSLLSNVGLLGTKVVTGGLDTLEGIGKKTMHILQDTDPNIKNKLRSINPSSRPNLSDLLQEAKNSDTIKENENVQTKVQLASFEHFLDEYGGLVFFEALEILSKQSKLKIELLLKPLTGKSLLEMEETLKEVEELYELPDSDSVNENITLVTLNDNLSKAVEDLAITMNFKDIVNYSAEINKWLEEFKEDEEDSKLVYNNSIETLAKLCSLSLNNYQKMAEMILSLTHRSTADEVDAIIQ